VVPDYEEEDEEMKEGEEDTAVYQEESQEQDPLLALADLRFLLTVKDDVASKQEKAEVKNKIMDHIKTHKMGPYYQHLCKEFGWPVDEALAKELKDANDAELKELDAKIEDAVQNLGDTEVRECHMKRADFYARIGDKEAALKAYAETLEKSVGSGSRIDLVFSVCRLALMWDDVELVKTNVKKAEESVEAGGDWERRNRLGVYRAVLQLMNLQMKDTAKSFLNAVSTFTNYKLFDYNRFIFYTVLSSVVALDRITLRDKVIKSPDVLSVINEIPHLHSLLHSLYQCRYKEFFIALANINTQIKRDRYFAPHIGYIMREARIVAYTQFLESYRSVQLSSMATTFGVTEDFLDNELSRFIASARINAKIDKVVGIVETNRPDAKNLQYTQTLTQGDLLLNRIQKLTKVIDY